MPHEKVVFTLKDHVACVTLNNPETGNYLDEKLGQDLKGACRRITEDDNVYVVLLTGAGDVFCRGGSPEDLSGSPIEVIA